MILSTEERKLIISMVPAPSQVLNHSIQPVLLLGRGAEEFELSVTGGAASKPSNISSMSRAAKSNSTVRSANPPIKQKFTH